MAVQQVFVRDATTNLPKELTPNTTSAGAADAGKLVALNGSGVLDSTLFPAGTGMASQVFPTSENLAAAALVNVYNNSGTPTARNANATDAAKPAIGFVHFGLDPRSATAIRRAAPDWAARLTQEESKA